MKNCYMIKFTIDDASERKTYDIQPSSCNYERVDGLNKFVNLVSSDFSKLVLELDELNILEWDDSIVEDESQLRWEIVIGFNDKIVIKRGLGFGSHFRSFLNVIKDYVTE